MLSDIFKEVQCVATEGVIVLVGSTRSQDKANVHGLDGNTGEELWSINIDGSGILANSEYGLFLGNGVKLDLIDPATGTSKWHIELLDAHNITSMMYFDGHLFIDSNGIYGSYVIGPDGQIIAKYIHPSDFLAAYGDIPFHPELPFGYVSDKENFIEQRGESLYSGYIYNPSCYLEMNLNKNP